MSKQGEIKALISLLDDEDPEVYEHVSSKLVSYGVEVIPQLEQAWEQTDNLSLHTIFEDLIHNIYLQNLQTELKEWIEDDLASLLDGALIVAKYHYPDLDTNEVHEKLDKVRQKIWLELNDGLTPIENIQVFNQVFYQILGFGSTTVENIQAQDFCINQVLENKKGNSISLGILYLILAQQLELPVYGVNLYRHFILSYQKNYVFDYDSNNAAETIFYINPLNKGVIFQRKDILEYLKSMNVVENPNFFNPATVKDIIKELLFYMQFYFSSKQEHKKALEIKDLKALFDTDSLPE